ncbi:MAG: hypothetical protein MJZ26_09135 [Fibrobacter sp.]|nr:hypothetical protein [Fibrobacter sp.]
MIICWSKNLGLTIEQVLYDYSFANLTLYSSALPQYGDGEGEKGKWNKDEHPELDANNPDNFKDLDIEEEE